MTDNITIVKNVTKVDVYEDVSVVEIKSGSIQGPKGDKGDAAAVITVGTTTTGNAGTSASVTSSGTSSNVVLNFTIPKGDKGDTGEQGLTGLTGATGATGAKGDKGDQGEVGATGDQGIPGIQGIKGDTGLQGDKGDKGDKGDTGETGLQGIQGPKGDTGSQGQAGASVTLKGSVANVAALPSTSNTIGDSYIVDADGNLWVWTGDSWFDAGQIVGPEGPVGSQGEQGIQGPKGDKGDKGDTGSQATFSVVNSTPPLSPVDGQAWYNSSDGLTYIYYDGYWVEFGNSLSGPQGIQGPKGDTGDQGATGATGSAATITLGTVGTGAEGSSVAITNSGTPGAAVFNFTIPKGDKGDTGETGATGATGATGETGPQGPQGNAVYAETNVTGSYSLIATDINSIVWVDSASANTITLPTDSTTIANGSAITIWQIGAGQTTIQGAVGVTVYSTGSGTNGATPKLRSQFGSAIAVKKSSNLWYVSGDIV